MPPCCLIKRRDTHQPVNSGFGSQKPVGVFAFNSERYTLQSSFLARLILEHLSFESTLLGPLEIHAQQHLGPILRFGAARARMNGANSVTAIVVAGQKHFSFSKREVVFKALKQRMEFLERRLVFLSKLKEHFRVSDLRFKVFLAFYLLFQATAILQRLLRGFLIVPEIRRGGLRLDLVQL